MSHSPIPHTHPPLWRNRVFQIVAFADLLQQLAIWTRNIALLFYVMEMTDNDPVAVSLLTMFEYLPIFIFSFIGGTFADRWNPKKTVIAGDTLSAISIGIIALCMMSGLWQAVFVATIVSAVVSQFSQPSSSILFKKHVPEEQVGLAVSITQGLMSIFVIVGPIIGTAIYTTLGIQYSLFVLIGLFLLAAIIQIGLPSSERSSESANNTVMQDMAEGFRYVKRNRNLVVIASIFTLIGLAVGIIQPLDVYILIERLGLHKENLQWFYAVSGIGMLLGGLLAAALSSRIQRFAKTVMFLGLLILAASIAFEVLSRWVFVTASMRFFVGITEAFLQIVLSTFMIKLVHADYIGRTNGILAPLMTGGVLIGSGAAGLLMSSTSLMTTFFISAALVAAAACISLQLSFPSGQMINEPETTAGMSKKESLPTL
ncbi:MFS transporter [Paenibacillus tyrfis]|uniref:MFS transporter n=1 Tax=Paenibacillus tyrfis TaxID=1501230 RepID=UPI00209F55B2|nr:MFS transporter [Paenibacillus tyrfis]MCP1308267.1 MFS transporter [Paenibacillus tyrfis]